MANDKDFILKNAVEVGGPTNVTLGTVTSGDVDLSTGNYFKDTPSGNSTYSISNAGDVQSFQLEVTGGTAADITWPSSIEWAGGVAPSAPAVGETDVFTITTDDGGTTYTGVKTADNLS